ncbi:MAG: divergent PAP2 family protein [Treponema sp.]|nr:divergent PAP2 family protein [Treponema sp.]MEE3434658.1 divergent PAP2 family protein [Treponema sp.]
MNLEKKVLAEIIANPVFQACLFSWFTAQFIKTVIGLFSGRIHSLKAMVESLIWRTGGFPSSHTALVTTLTTCVGFRSGVSSDTFMLSFCFLLVTIRDALGVRRASGLQARKLNELGNDLADKKMIDYKPIKEILGHRPMEVIFGAILGFFIGLGFAVL